MCTIIIGILDFFPQLNTRRRIAEKKPSRNPVYGVRGRPPTKDDTPFTPADAIEFQFLIEKASTVVDKMYAKDT